MDSIRKQSLIYIGEEGSPAERTILRFIKERFPDRFEVSVVPLEYNQTGENTAIEKLRALNRQRTASLVILFDDSISHESHEATKPLLMPDMLGDVQRKADALLRESDDGIRITYEPNTGNPVDDAVAQSNWQESVAQSREQDREQLIRQLAQRKEAATNLFLTFLPNDAGINVAVGMRENGSPMEETPLVVMGLYPGRKHAFVEICGEKSLVYSSDDIWMSQPGYTLEDRLNSVAEFIAKNVPSRGR